MFNMIFSFLSIMKRIFLLLFILTTVSNFSYASFPVLENVKKSSVKHIESTVFLDSEDVIYYGLGFFVGFLSVLLYFLPLLFLFFPNKSFRKGIYIGLITLLVTLFLLFGFNVQV